MNSTDSVLEVLESIFARRYGRRSWRLDDIIRLPDGRAFGGYEFPAGLNAPSFSAHMVGEMTVMVITISVGVIVTAVATVAAAVATAAVMMMMVMARRSRRGRHDLSEKGHKKRGRI